MSVSQVEYLAAMNAQPEAGVVEILPEDDVRVVRWFTPQAVFEIRIGGGSVTVQQSPAGPNATAAAGLPASRHASRHARRMALQTRAEQAAGG